MTLPAFAAAPLLLSAAAVDRYIFPHGVQQQNRRTPLLLLIDGTDGHRETDARRFTALAVSTSCVQLPTSADNVALPAFAAERRAAAAPAMQQSIDIACRLDPQQQTRRSGDRKLGQTKTRTGLYIDTAPHSTRACKFTMEGGAYTLMLSDGRRCSVSRVHRCSKVPGMLTKTIQCV